MAALQFKVQIMAGLRANLPLTSLMVEIPDLKVEEAVSRGETPAFRPPDGRVVVLPIHRAACRVREPHRAPDFFREMSKGLSSRETKNRFFWPRHCVSTRNPQW